jgi:hypothetical protein
MVYHIINVYCFITALIDKDIFIKSTLKLNKSMNLLNFFTL